MRQTDLNAVITMLDALYIPYSGRTEGDGTTRLQVSLKSKAYVEYEFDNSEKLTSATLKD